MAPVSRARTQQMYQLSLKDGLVMFVRRSLDAFVILVIEASPAAADHVRRRSLDASLSKPIIRKSVIRINS